VLGGGSILTQDEYSCQLDAARASGLPLLVWGAGWDPRGDVSQDKKLIQDVQAAFFGSRPSGVVNFSLTDAWVNRFRRAGETGVGGVRGPITLAALRSAVPQSQLTAIGDSGILAPLPHASVRGTRPWFLPPCSTCWATGQLLHQQQQSEQWIAVGLGKNQGASIFHDGQDAALEAAWDDMLVHMVARLGLRVAIYAMDPSSFDAGAQCYQRAAERLVAAAAAVDGGGEHNEDGQLHFIPHVLDSPSVIHLFDYVRASVNYKLHGSVMSAAVGTPFVAMAYHVKHLDFGADAELPVWCLLRTDEIAARASGGEQDANAGGSALLIERLETLLSIQDQEAVQDGGADAARRRKWWWGTSTAEEEMRSVLVRAREHTQQRYEEVAEEFIGRMFF
jgi:hypothetical protein